MEVNENELKDLKVALTSVVEKIDLMLGKDEQIGNEWWNRRCSVLAEVYAKGGVVTSEEFIKIASKYNISGSGAGGFFAGSKSGGGSMIKLGGDKRALTSKGETEVVRWLKEEQGRCDKFKIDHAKLFF